MSGVGSRETGLDSLFASKPVGPEPCLGQSANLAGAPKPLCLSVCQQGLQVADLRGQFPDIFQPHQTMQQLMWQPNMLQVAKFLDAGMKKLQTVDPNEGSNI